MGRTTLTGMEILWEVKLVRQNRTGLWRCWLSGRSVWHGGKQETTDGVCSLAKVLKTPTVLWRMDCT